MIYTDVRTISASLLKPDVVIDDKVFTLNISTGEITHVSISEQQKLEREKSIRESIERLELFHSLWKELHAKQDANQEWFDDWVSRVPNSGCGCLPWLADYLTTNSPRFDDFFEWSIELHDAVNVKLSKPIWTRT